MADGGSRWRHNKRAARGICNLGEGEARLAELAVEAGIFVLKMRRTGVVDVAQLMQHRPLLGKYQQQRECTSKANPMHVNDNARLVSFGRLPQQLGSVEIADGIIRNP